MKPGKAEVPDEVQDCLAGSSIFLTLDLQSVYWQLPVNQSDKRILCWTWHGLFQFSSMPFGLTEAPSSFQCFMDKIF